MHTKKGIVLTVLLAAVILAIVVFVFPAGNRRPSFTPRTPTPTPKPVQVSGQITKIDVATRSITINAHDKSIILLLVEKGKIIDENGGAISLDALRVGQFLSTKSTVKGENFFIVDTIVLIKQPNIIVSSPKQNEKIGLVFLLSGEARVFENQFSYRVIKKQTGEIVAHGQLYANAPDVGMYGRFSQNITLPPQKLDSGALVSIEVFDNSPKDGSEQDKVTIQAQVISLNR